MENVGDLVPALEAAAEEHVHDLVGRTTLPQLVALARRARLLVTCDTGPMHIAHAVGTPNLAIFGPSDPVRYGPEGEGEKRFVLRQPLYCSPCNMIRKPPPECLALDAPECLQSIGVDRALNAALGLLDKRKSLI